MESTDYHYSTWGSRPTSSGAGVMTTTSAAPSPTVSVQLRCPFGCRRRILSKLCRMTIAITFLLMIVLNVIFILDAGYKLRYQNFSSESIFSDGDAELAKPISDQHSFDVQPQFLVLDIVSSQSRASVSVNGATVLDNREEIKGRGIHVLVLNQVTGSVMARRLFDTYSPREDEALSLFLNLVTNGRIIILVIKDEGSFHLKQPTRELLQRFGSKEVKQLNWRDAWIFAFQKESALKGVPVCEHLNKSPNFSSWAESLFLTCRLPLTASILEPDCLWTNTEEDRRRKEFCNHVEGYGSVCDCRHPAPITFRPEPITNNRIGDVPVGVIASNRPHYLYRSLRSLLGASGANASMITVFIDGFFEEPMQVVRLFNLNGIQHKPIGVRNARISQHYKAALSTLFTQHPNARFAILVEEDLDIALDFFSYFNQLAHLLEEDPTLYCISAWNDHGYRHSTLNPSQLYRVETMPGLGWMLTRKLFKEELELAWPTHDKMWDWDMWLRKSKIRRGRECIIPDVPRTYHFGAFGMNMNSYFQDVYFRQRALNNLPNVKLGGVNDLKASNYEKVIEVAIANASLLNHHLSPCEESFIPNTKDKSYVLYMQMRNSRDTTTWLQIAKCFKIWDLDARGSHRGLWRFYMKENAIIVIGVPFSPYSKFKPHDIVPLKLTPEATTKKSSNR